MNEASERDETADRPDPGVGPAADAPGATAWTAPSPEVHERAPRPHGGRWEARREARREGRRRGHGAAQPEYDPRHPTGLAASMVTSGGMLLAMVEDVRMRGGTQPEDLRPLADTFARHSAAKEATVRKVLERHHEVQLIVRRDREESDLIQSILDRALTGRHPEDTRHLTIDGALTQMYQYLIHERRDLAPALQRVVPAEESETLSAAFEAINQG